MTFRISCVSVGRLHWAIEGSETRPYTAVRNERSRRQARWPWRLLEKRNWKIKGGGRSQLLLTQLARWLLSVRLQLETFCFTLPSTFHRKRGSADWSTVRFSLLPTQSSFSRVPATSCDRCLSRILSSHEPFMWCPVVDSSHQLEQFTEIPLNCFIGWAAPR